jgi:peroxiredoxin
MVTGLLAVTGCAAPPATRAQTQKQPAPDFTLNDTDGKPVSLHDLLQRGPVLLAFFPKAFTPG